MSTQPATQLKVAVITVGNWLSDNFPTEMLLPPWAVTSPPIPLTLEWQYWGQEDWLHGKIPRAYQPGTLFEDHREMLVTQHASLPVAHLSIGGNLSLSQSPEPQCRSAALAPAAPRERQCGRWETGAVSHRHRPQVSRLDIADLWKNVLPEALLVLSSSSRSQSCFNAEINNEEKFLPKGGFFVPLKALPQSPLEQECQKHTENSWKVPWGGQWSYPSAEWLILRGEEHLKRGCTWHDSVHGTGQCLVGRKRWSRTVGGLEQVTDLKGSSWISWAVRTLVSGRGRWHDECGTLEYGLWSPSTRKFQLKVEGSLDGKRLEAGKPARCKVQISWGSSGLGSSANIN